MRIAVIGAGAIGGLLAATLAAAHHKVVVLARGALRAAMASNGLTLRGTDGAVTHSRPEVIDDLSALPDCDFAFLTVKAHHLSELAAPIEGIRGRIGTLVSIQNGVPWWFCSGVGAPLSGTVLRSIDHDGAIGRAIGSAGLIAGLAFKSAHVAAPGVIGHIPSATDQFVFGAVGGKSPDRCEDIVALLRSAGLPALAVADLRGRVWTKLLGNVAINPLSAIGRCPIGGILDHAPSRALMRAVMGECMAIAVRLGVAAEGSIDDRVRRIEAMRAARPSMLQDFEAGRQMEIAAIVGAPAELAMLTGVPAPNLHAVHAMIGLLAASQHGHGSA